MWMNYNSGCCRPSDDDSWGRASDNSDEEAYLTASEQATHNQAGYPLPPMSFALVPVQHPGFLANKKPGKQVRSKNQAKGKTKFTHPVRT